MSTHESKKASTTLVWYKTVPAQGRINIKGLSELLVGEAGKVASGIGSVVISFEKEPPFTGEAVLGFEEVGMPQPAYKPEQVMVTVVGKELVESGCRATGWYDVSVTAKEEVATSLGLPAKLGGMGYLKDPVN